MPTLGPRSRPCLAQPVQSHPPTWYRRRAGRRTCRRTCRGAGAPRSDAVRRAATSPLLELTNRELHRRRADLSGRTADAVRSERWLPIRRTVRSSPLPTVDGRVEESHGTRERACRRSGERRVEPLTAADSAPGERAARLGSREELEGETADSMTGHQISGLVAGRSQGRR